MLMRPDGTVAGRHANAGLKTPIHHHDGERLNQDRFGPSELPDISVIDVAAGPAAKAGGGCAIRTTGNKP